METLTDGVVTLRALQDGDTSILIAGRDEQFHRFMGTGRDDPRPLAVIEVDAGGEPGLPEVVGWVDHDDDRDWLTPDQCNVGYNVFAAHRGRGYASRAVRLLLGWLGTETRFTEATFLVDAENAPSLRVVAAVGAVERGRWTDHNGRLQVFLAVGLGDLDPRP